MRASIEQSKLREVVGDLRNQGYSNKNISQAIGSRIDSCLYNGYTLPLDSFQKLENLHGSNIPHKVVEKSHGSACLHHSIDSLEKDEELAELFGIILGDGHIHSQNQDSNKKGINYLEITLNSKEKDLRIRTEYLVRSKTGLKPNTYSKKGNCLRIVIHSKDLIKKFLDTGLESGNKKQNQVGIPEWIKNNKKYSKYCIGGLIDTDGSIYHDVREGKSYLRIQLSNHSRNLIKDFNQACRLIGINTVKGGENQIQVARKDVDEFIDNIEPVKSNRLKLLQE